MNDSPAKKPSPKWLDNDNYGKVQQSKKHEKRIAKALGGRRLPRSGANRWSKWDKTTANGDIASPDLHIEHKRTEQASMSLKREWLEKVCLGARAAGKDPAVVITFEGAKQIPEDWALIPMDVLQRLLDGAKKT